MPFPYRYGPKQPSKNLYPFGNGRHLDAYLKGLLERVEAAERIAQIRAEECNRLLLENRVLRNTVKGFNLDPDDQIKHNGPALEKKLAANESDFETVYDEVTGMTLVLCPGCRRIFVPAHTGSCVICQREEHES